MPGFSHIVVLNTSVLHSLSIARLHSSYTILRLLNHFFCRWTFDLFFFFLFLIMMNKATMNYFHKSFSGYVFSFIMDKYL